MRINFKHILFFISIIFLSCKNETENESVKTNSKTIYSENEYMKLWIKDKEIHKKIKIVDTFCINQTRRAKNDIKNNKLTYFVPFGNGNYDRSDKELSILLKKYNIKIDTLLIYCVRTPGFDRSCYQKTMNNAISKKFGENFIDSLRYIADKEFIMKNSNYIFDFTDCDLTSRYFKAKTYEEFLEMPENDFIDYLNTKSSKKERANTEVFFVIYRNGKVGNIRTQTNYSITNDKKFADLFENEAINFVKKSKWLPAKYRGIEVNSEMHINFYNK